LAEKVKVALRTADWKGAPVPAEVAVWAVDEGVLRLTAYEPPDPLDALQPERGLSVRIGEPLIHLVRRTAYADKGMSSGGGGGAEVGGGLRSQFKTTVLFAPAVVTGADGKAEVVFTLPDNLTTYRIMALAIDRGDRGGKGGGTVQVSKPLLAMPALPRLARVGDTVEAGVVVHAASGKIQSVEVTATATGPLKLQGETRRTLALPEPGHEVAEAADRRARAGDLVEGHGVPIYPRAGPDAVPDARQRVDDVVAGQDQHHRILDFRFWILDLSGGARRQYCRGGQSNRARCVSGHWFNEQI
jgi:uncharacterized protein YfaS (alpha-2-macroglobulin family)